MKKNICYLLVLVFTVSITGCMKNNNSEEKRMSRAAYLSGTNEEKSNMLFTMILDYTRDENIEGLKSLFSRNALEEIDDIDKKIGVWMSVLDCRIEEYDGGVYYSESPTTWGRGADGKPETGHGYRLIASSYDIKTESMRYTISFVFQDKNEADEGEIGISILEVVAETHYDEDGGYVINPYNAAPGIFIHGE